MKELSIEEKARRYDEAIKKVNDYYEGKTKLYSDVDKTLDYLFPALKESEDERIRKAIVLFFETQDESTTYSFVRRNDILAWLEKHKYTEEDLDKAYKCADEVQYRRGYEDAKKEIEKQGEQKPVDKVEQEYHCTGVREPKEATGVLKQLLNKENYAWSDEDEAYRVDILVKLEPHITDDNFTDVQNWFKSIKDRVQPQPKQEWSEEDKVKINRTVAFLENLNLEHLNVVGNDILLKDIEWLKSLRPQNTWKPSKEQIDAFEHFVRSIGESGYASPYDNNTKLLYSLLLDLKKLK